MKLARAPKGRPFLDDEGGRACRTAGLASLCFDVSHHGKWVALAAESDFSVGLDLASTVVDRLRLAVAGGVRQTAPEAARGRLESLCGALRSCLAPSE